MRTGNNKDISLLIVEDEELIRTMIKLNLEKEGYKVNTAESGEEMLELVNENKFDLILLDIMLPGISGEKALAELRAHGLKTPVIMVTAKADTETKVNALNIGADDYLSKPFDRKELLARINAMIRRNYE